MTVAPVDTVQHCSLCSLNPDTPSDVCIKFESNEGKMGPELEELESPSAGTGLETPGQQCPPNEGTWETGRTTATGFLTACVGSSQGRNISSPTTESISVDTRASTKSTATLADTSSPTEHVGTLAATAATPENRRRKTSSEQNKQFDPGGKGEKAPPWNAAVSLLFFFWEELGGFLFVLCASCFVSALCVLCFPKLLIYPGDTSQRSRKT